MDTASLAHEGATVVVTHRVRDGMHAAYDNGHAMREDRRTMRRSEAPFTVTISARRERT
jgi:hypothetical protein